MTTTNTRPTADEARRLIRDLRTRLTADEVDEGFMSWATRANGDVGAEEPGDLDLDEAARVRDAFNARWAGCAVRQITGEWVAVEVGVAE